MADGVASGDEPRLRRPTMKRGEQTDMKRLITLALLLVPVLAFAESTEKSGMQDGRPYFQATESMSQTGKVVAINAATREVTVLVSKRDTVILECGPEVKNFAQIAKGDVVKAKYTETLTVHVEETGNPTMTTESNSSSAKPGEKPHASQNDRLRFSATITHINKEHGSVTLKGYRGNSWELTPRDPANLDKVKVGQLVVFTYDAAVAASVEKVSNKNKSSSKPKPKKEASEK